MSMKGFSMKHSIEENLPRGEAIIFIILSFDLFVKSDLSYYAEVLGMPASTSYWCPFCLLSRPEWQQSAEIIGAEHTVEFQRTTYTAVVSDIEKKLLLQTKKVSPLKCTINALHLSILYPHCCIERLEW
jgi:hypothetical protein